MSGCSDDPQRGRSSSAGADVQTCDKVAPAWTRTFALRPVLGASAAAGGCGDALVAFAGGVASIDADGNECGKRPWPAGFTPDSLKRLRPSGLLAIDKARKRVFRVEHDGFELWLALAASSAATVTAADESRCGVRAAILTDSAGPDLRRLDDPGNPLWQRKGKYNGVAASCDSVYAAGWRPFAADDPRTFPHEYAWLRRFTLSGQLAWSWEPTIATLHATGIRDPTILGAGVAVRADGHAHGADYHYLGYLYALNRDGVPTVGHQYLNKYCCSLTPNQTADLAATPVAWPDGAAAWPVSRSGGYQCPYSEIDVVVPGTAGAEGFETAIHRAKSTGTGPSSCKPSTKPTRWAEAAARVGDDLLIGGDQADGDGWLARLPACSTPTG